MNLKTFALIGILPVGILFLMVIDWVMRKTVDGQRTDNRWDVATLLEDIDYADDLFLPTSRVDHMQ